MGLFTPDPERRLHPAERFQWRWSRIFLVVLLGTVGAGAGLAVLDKLGWVSEWDLIETLIVWPLAVASVASLAGALVLPVAAFLATRVPGTREGVTPGLRGMAVMGSIFTAAVTPWLFRSLPGWLGWAVLGVCGGTFVWALVSRTTTPSDTGTSWIRLPVAMALLSVFIFSVYGYAGPYFSQPREKAYSAAMRSDLRNLQSLQEIHRDEHGTYSSDSTVGGELQYSHGVILDELRADSTEWRARTTYEGRPDLRCRVRVRARGNTGDGGGDDGVIRCEGIPSPYQKFFWFFLSIPAMLVVLTGIAVWEIRRPDRPGPTAPASAAPARPPAAGS